MKYSLRTQTYFRLSLVSAENNVCEPEPGNDFGDVGILSQSQFSSSSPRTTARGVFAARSTRVSFSEILTLPIWSGDSRFHVLPPALPIHIKFSRFIIYHKIVKTRGKMLILRIFCDVLHFLLILSPQSLTECCADSSGQQSYSI